MVDKGWIGVGHRRLAAVVGVPEVASLASRAGLRSGDLVLSVDGIEVEDWQALQQVHSLAVERARLDGQDLIVWRVAREPSALALSDAGSPPTSESRSEMDAGSEAEPPEFEEISISLPARKDLDRLGLEDSNLRTAN